VRFHAGRFLCNHEAPRAASRNQKTFFTTKGTKHALSKVEGSTKFIIPNLPNRKYYLTTKHTKATKVSEIDISKLLNFVFFVPSW
jgi:hypothetical protein